MAENTNTKLLAAQLSLAPVVKANTLKDMR